MRRKVLTLVAFAFLAMSAGCLTGGGPSEDDLAENATYDWEDDANVSITLVDGGYQSVYDVTNQTRLDVFGRATFGQQEPLSAMSALRFRYPNGTIVGPEAMNVSSSRSRTRIGLPDKNGSVAFTVERTGKELRTGVFLEGSYSVTLPPSTDVGVPLLSNVVPGGYNKSTVDGQTRLYWENVDTEDLVVRYYFDRDLLLFGGFFTLMFGAALAGGLYYWRQIRQLARQREAVDLDVEDGREK